MTTPARRSTSFKGISRRTPGGKTSLLGKLKKPSASRCALCGRLLAGVPRRRSSDLIRLSKTQKRPERAFGGVLCPADVAILVKEKTRLRLGEIDEHDVDITHLKYLRQMKHQ